MSKQKILHGSVVGTVIEMLPNLEFKVEFADGKIMRCYVSGKMKIAKVKVFISDRVDVIIPEQGEIGRIVWRRD